MLISLLISSVGLSTMLACLVAEYSVHDFNVFMATGPHVVGAQSINQSIMATGPRVM